MISIGGFSHSQNKNWGMRGRPCPVGGGAVVNQCRPNVGPMWGLVQKPGGSAGSTYIKPGSQSLLGLLCGSYVYQCGVLKPELKTEKSGRTACRLILRGRSCRSGPGANARCNHHRLLAWMKSLRLAKRGTRIIRAGHRTMV